MDLRPLLLAALAAGGLAGCSGSSDDDEDDGIDLGPAPGFAALEAEDARLEGEIDDALTANGGFTDPASLPTSGSATYDGVLTIDATGDLTDAPEVMRGELSLAVDFEDADDPLSGGAGNFAGSREDRQTGVNSVVPLDGVLAIGDGTLDREADPDGNGWTYSADLVGTLTDDGTGIEVDANLLGDFAGAQPEYATGIVRGVVTVGEQAEVVGGDFVAER